MADSGKCQFKDCDALVCDNDSMIINGPRFCLIHSEKIDGLLKIENVKGAKSFWKRAGYDWSNENKDRA